MRLIILTGPIASALGGMAIAAITEGALGQLNPQFVLPEEEEEGETGASPPHTVFLALLIPRSLAWPILFARSSIPFSSCESLI